MHFTVAVAAALVALLGGCSLFGSSASVPAGHASAGTGTSSSSTATPAVTTPTGPAAVAVARTHAVPVGSTATPNITVPALTAPQVEGLQTLTKIGLPVAVGTPTEISLPAGVPAGGVQLTRTYPSPLPAQAAATLAFYDDALGAWHAVPSQLSADRMTLTATVHHLSLWTDIVGGLAGGATWAFNQLGKIVDTRVDPPSCSGPNPSWVSSTDYLPNAAQNPLLYCTGHDTVHPDRLVIKVRVNRGYGFTVKVAGSTAWRYNSTEAQPGEFQSLRQAVAQTDTMAAGAVAQLFAGGDLVGPGQEYSLGMTNAAAAAVTAGRPDVTLTPASVYAFMSTLTSKLVVGDILDQAQGTVAMGVALATCANDLVEVTDVGSAVKAANSCINDLDVQVATQVGLVMQKIVDPRTHKLFTASDAGKLAGKIVGLASITTAIAYPIMTYWMDRSLSPASRTVTVFAKAPPKPAATTQRILINLLDSNGQVKPGYQQDTQTVDAPLDCLEDQPSPNAVSPGTHWCGSTADSTFACWAVPAVGANAVACLFYPWEKKYVLRSVSIALTQTPAPQNPEPLGIQLDDGSLFWYRIGGAWDPGPDGAAPTYGCQSGCPANTFPVLLEAKAATPGAVTDSIGLVQRGNDWYAWEGLTGGAGTNLSPAELKHIAKMWFITTS